MRGMGTLYRQRGSVWWISLSIGGRRRRQSTGKEKFKEACDVLKNISREQSSDLQHFQPIHRPRARL